MSEDLVLKTVDLTKHYGGVRALDGANFQLKKGEHVAIMGDNGAGKSTFVRQITGVEQRSRGTIIQLRPESPASKLCFKHWP
jgi:fructose transport system ATP-binding protein